MSEAREKLQRAQAELAAALVRGRAVPEGFLAPRVRLSARVLTRKRQREAFSTVPQFEQSLGPEAEPLFQRYARETPYPAQDGPVADALQFKRWLRLRGK